MEKIAFHKKQGFWGILIMVGFMTIHIFGVNVFADGLLPAVWVGGLIGGLIRYLMKKDDVKEIVFGWGFCLAMLLNYILFRYGHPYIPNYIIIFIGFAAINIYDFKKKGTANMKEKAALVLILLVAFFAIDYYQYSSNIIKGRGFRRLIKKEYGIQGKIDKEDLKGIEKLDIDDNDRVNNIEGIRYFQDVKSIYISDASTIKDLRPLANLSKLEELTIWYSNVDKIEEIPKIESLERIDIVYPKAGKIDSLENFPNLKRFEIQGMDFDNLNGLEGPKNLERLDIGDGRLTTFDGVEKFPYLKEVDLYEMSINDISRIFELRELKSVELQGGYIHNRDYFDKMARERGIVVKERGTSNVDLLK
ncbi:hypothetical protein R9X47_26860 [Wukongibacter baidiensis]|uniref:leucine-rich repeat domain-containing protein n=1 Tax=Wukongibacter baidiensis TaxID=1723361 RepID=UPI003D7FADC5